MQTHLTLGDEQVAKMMSQYYKLVQAYFDFYCAAESTESFALSSQAFRTFCTDTGILDTKACRWPDCETVYNLAIYKHDKSSVDNRIMSRFTSPAILRFEFMECLVRLALHKFGHGVELGVNVTGALNSLFNEHLVPDAPCAVKVSKGVFLDPNTFRTTVFYRFAPTTTLRATIFSGQLPDELLNGIRLLPVLHGHRCPEGGASACSEHGRVAAPQIHLVLGSRVEEREVENHALQTWSIKESVFASRSEECHARSHTNMDHTTQRMFDVDWERMINKPNIRKVLRSYGYARDPDNENAAEEMVEE
eukprot:gene15597-18492_t